MKKLKAFTVLELLVAMVISSLVIGASYFTYDIIYKQFLNFKNVDGKVLSALTLQNVLNNDISAGELLYKTDHGIRIVNHEGEEYKFIFENEQIVRKAGNVRDTFAIRTVKIAYDEIEGTSDTKGLLSKLEIVIVVNDEQNILSFHKQYGADLLMLAEGETKR